MDVTIRRLRGVVVLSAFAAGLFTACSRECKVPPLLETPVETADILVSREAGDARPFGVDICIDATPSMEGFATPADSTYRTFLEDLEGSFISGVKNVSDVRYFKFGETIRQMTRTDFRQAHGRAFYHEPGIFKTTNLELVFRTDGGRRSEGKAVQANAAQVPPAPPRDARRVVVVVTDLFQQDQDVNAVVQQIKTSCLSDRQCSVALLAIPSPFEGTVYDARVPSYPYRSTSDPATFRPFYLLMFGPEDELRRFADVLSSRKYIDLRRFTIVGARTVSQFSAELQPDRTVKGVTPRQSCDAPLDLYVNLRKNYDRAAVKAVLKIVPDAQSFAFNPARVAVRVFRESDGRLIPAGDEVATTITPASGALALDAAIRPPQAKGDYLYVFELRTGDVNGFLLPSWITGFTSPDPRPGRDPGKTLNLDRFVEQLIATSMLADHHQPKLARFRVLIHKL